VGDLEMLRGQAASHVFSQHNTLRDGRTFGFALDLLLQKVFFLSIGVYLSQLKQRFTADAFLFLISFLDVACFLFFSL